MSFTPDLVINTKTYSLKAQRTNSSVRSDAARDIAAPKTLTVSHETAKSGKQSSVVYLDDTKVIPGSVYAPVSDTVRAMVKIQYNPLVGRTALEADLIQCLADIAAFIGDSTYIDKLLNQET